MPKNKGGGGGGKGAKGGGDDDSSKKQAKGGNSVKVILICLTVLPLGRVQQIIFTHVLNKSSVHCDSSKWFIYYLKKCQ